MKKNWFKAVALCGRLLPTFSPFHLVFSQSYPGLNKDGQSVFQSAMVENNDQDCANPHIEYFAAAINKLYNTIASVNRVVKI